MRFSDWSGGSNKCFLLVALVSVPLGIASAAPNAQPPRPLDRATGMVGTKFRLDATHSRSQFTFVPSTEGRIEISLNTSNAGEESVHLRVDFEDPQSAPLCDLETRRPLTLVLRVPPSLVNQVWRMAVELRGGGSCVGSLTAEYLPGPLPERDATPPAAPVLNTAPDPGPGRAVQPTPAVKGMIAVKSGGMATSKTVQGVMAGKGSAIAKSGTTDRDAIKDAFVAGRASATLSGPQNCVERTIDEDGWVVVTQSDGHSDRIDPRGGREDDQKADGVEDLALPNGEYGEYLRLWSVRRAKGLLEVILNASTNKEEVKRRILAHEKEQGLKDLQVVVYRANLLRYMFPNTP